MELKKEQEQQSDWREWLNEHGSKLLLFARQQSRSLADAEDILQDALVKLAKKVAEGEFVGGRNAWLSYVYTAIRRQAIDLGRSVDRRRKREEIVSEESVEKEKHQEHLWFSSESADGEQRLILEEKLREIPDKFREVIVMKVWGEQTFAEIGEILNISQNTAASRYRYGLEALRKLLDNARTRGDV